MRIERIRIASAVSVQSVAGCVRGCRKGNWCGNVTQKAVERSGSGSVDWQALEQHVCVGEDSGVDGVQAARDGGIEQRSGVVGAIE